MENKINISAIELYSRKAVKPMMDKYFIGEKINGKDILQFSPIDQVNYFIIHQLFVKWMDETQKLRSPYFDFENVKVQEALKKFMGELSQYILVQKDDFTPLLLQSIFNSIYYVVAPIHFLEQKYFQADKLYSTEELANSSRYLKAYPDLVNFIKEHANQWGNKNGKMIIDTLKSKFGSYFSNEDVKDSMMANFNSVLPVLPSDFYYSETVKVQEPAILAKEEKHITINELMGKEQKATTLNLHTKNKIVDIRSAMSINQKFMFIKELFKGDNTAFEGAMTLADGCDSYENAVNALIDTYSQRFSWIIDSDEVNELFDLVGRKFFPEGSAKQAN